MLIAALPLLSGCNAVLLSPSGDVALQQRNLIIISTVLMLLIIVPVILLTFLPRGATAPTTRPRTTIPNGTTPPCWSC